MKLMTRWGRKLDPAERVLAEILYVHKGPKWVHKVFNRDIEVYGSEADRPDEGPLWWRGLVWVALLREELSVRTKRLKYRFKRRNSGGW